jgi:hypothetical protein
MSVIPQTPRASRGLRPLAPYQGSALDPLGTLCGPQIPRLLTLPLTTNPRSAPDDVLFMLFVFTYIAVQHVLTIWVTMVGVL